MYCTITLKETCYILSKTCIIITTLSGILILGFPLRLLRRPARLLALAGASSSIPPPSSNPPVLAKQQRGWKGRDLGIWDALASPPFLLLAKARAEYPP